jgi:hypothetical protein
MPLLNFMRRFVEPIRAGSKAHTIRAERVYPIKPGDPLFLYCGARRPGAFRILPKPVTCTRVEPIFIGELFEVRVSGLFLDPAERELLAMADGFPEGFEEMMEFWTGRLPFKGQIIHWPPAVKHG